MSQAYALYEEMPNDDEGITWSMLPGVSVTFLGIGEIHGDRVAVFQGPDLPDQENLGAITLLREEDLNHSMAVLPYDNET